jgi:hypothetical protein
MNLSNDVATIRQGDSLIEWEPAAGGAELVDLRTQTVTRLTVAAGVRLALLDGRAYAVDAAAGQVVRLADGTPVINDVAAPIGRWAETADALWFTVPATGTVLRLTPTGTVEPIGDAFPAGHDPVLTGLTDGVALLDGAAVTRLDKHGLAGRGTVPALPATVTAVRATDDDQLVILAGSTVLAGAGRVTVGASGDVLGDLVVLGDRAYVADDTTGALWTVRLAPTVAVLPPTDVAGHGAALEVFTQGSMVWVNDPAGPHALAVDRTGTQHPLIKYTLTTPSPTPTRSQQPSPPSNRPTRPSTGHPDGRATPTKGRTGPPRTSKSPTSPAGSGGSISAHLSGLPPEVSHCADVGGPVSIPAGDTLLVAVQRTSPSSPDWYFSYAAPHHPSGRLTSYHTTVYFGTATDQRYQVVLLVLNADTAQAFYDAHAQHNGDYAVATNLPASAYRADHRTTTQTTLGC